MYAALWCKSNGSFLEGASHPEELVETAHALGLAAIAVTDRDGVYGIVRAHQKAQELGVRLIIGSEITLDDGATIVLLVMDRAGYANLCGLISKGRLRSPKGQSRVAWDEVCAHAGGLIALWRGEAHVADRLKAAFGDRLYLLLERHRLAEEVAEEARRRARGREHGVPLVASTEVLYHLPGRRPLQDVLTCIRHNVTLDTAGRRLRANAEHDLKTPFVFANLYADDPIAVARTREIAERCRFTLAEIRYRYPSEKLPDGKTSAEYLRELTLLGARGRYGGAIPDDVLAQLEKELLLIHEHDYCGYFLTMYEVVDFCRRENILCQGRGSAANSAVCYCLGITAVDPVRMGLLFERFLSKERAEPPDIDLDIEHERREEVIQHVYRKYGRTHSAMVANFIRYRTRSAIRDVGKALGLSETNLDRLARLSTYHDSLADAYAQAGIADREGRHHLFLALCEEIRNFPRHLSIHPGGFLLGHEAVSTLVPIENATMPERTVIQWDKDDVEAIGLFKVDLLGLGALHHLHLCFDLLQQHRGVSLSMATIPEGDVATYDAICKSDTVGVFQIESRAQMSMLPRLKPRTYYDLVVQVSIVRPGPITGGMVHPYLRRRNGEEPIEYPHPCLEPVLKKTLGVPLFQEQVMKLAIVAADYTPGEADQLRRDMAAWRRTGSMEKHHERLITRMQKKGIALEFAERIFKQICGFGEYGFPESHAASFALVSYAGSYLKRHYPAEFCCSLLNAQPMGFYTPSTILGDAGRHGVEIRPIDVQRSHWHCTLERIDASDASDASDHGANATPRFAVRMGLRYIKGLGEADGAILVRAAPFVSIDDLARRTQLSERVRALLAEGGALDSLEGERRRALWQAKGPSPSPLAIEEGDAPQSLPALSALETINWDYRRTSHSTRGHPLEMLRDALGKLGLPDAHGVAAMPDGRRVRYAGMVICRQHPGTAAGVTFMTLEDETGFVNVVVWEKVFAQNALVLKTEPFLGVEGKLQKQDGVVHVIADRFFRPRIAAGDTPASGGSRDFH